MSGNEDHQKEAQPEIDPLLSWVKSILAIHESIGLRTFYLKSKRNESEAQAMYSNEECPKQPRLDPIVRSRLLDILKILSDIRGILMVGMMNDNDLYQETAAIVAQGLLESMILIGDLVKEPQ